MVIARHSSSRLPANRERSVFCANEQSVSSRIRGAKEVADRGYLNPNALPGLEMERREVSVPEWHIRQPGTAGELPKDRSPITVRATPSLSPIRKIEPYNLNWLELRSDQYARRRCKATDVIGGGERRRSRNRPCRLPGCCDRSAYVNVIEREQ